MIRKSNHHQTTGFTIVELMIAMAFISLLLLAIAAAVMQVAAIYNKGITMKSVNQAGRLIVSDIKRTISEGQLDSVTFVPHPVAPNGSSTDYNAGRLCTGSYSYIWNIGKYVNLADPTTQVNKYRGADSSKPLRLVKLRDSGGLYCKDGASGPVEFSDATELLSEGDGRRSNLAVQSFYIERATDNLATGMALYTVRIKISDADTEAIDTVDNSCRPPSEDLSNQNYCAVNEFVFTARAGSRGGQ